MNPPAVRTQRMLSFMFRDERCHFLPELIADLPLVARHLSPSEIAVIYYLTIPFGIGSKYLFVSFPLAHYACVVGSGSRSAAKADRNSARLRVLLQRRYGGRHV